MRQGGLKLLAIAGALIAALVAGPRAHAQAVNVAQEDEDLRRLSIGELADIDVTSVSKSAEALSGAPAAIYVITHEEILRSGATSIPEMLRLAPNLAVAQTASPDYVVTARGFNGNTAAQAFSNKLLVLIDGRSVYTPLFSGVYWDMQDVLPEDIDRIEVISGPGATLWGANAVNGVINIITRPSSRTQGGLVAVDGGNLERGAAARFGGRLSDSASFRLYAKGFYRAGLQTPAGAPTRDHWSLPQGGFRLDWAAGPADQVTLQGDAGYGTEAQTTSVGTGNILARWTHDFATGSQLQVQSYVDREVRGADHAGGSGFWQNTWDLEAQHSFALGARHQLVWGGGVRLTRYRIAGAGGLQFVPPSRTLTLADGFVQDTVSLAQRLKLILGLKLEDDPYSGLSALPSARVSFTPSDGAMLWAAASRAIRSPTPFDVDVAEHAGPAVLLGNPEFQPESLIAYEAGVRVQPTPRASLSVSAYYNVYDRLRSIEPTPGTFFPITWGNGIEGHTYGVEAWGSWQAASWWRLSAGMSLLSMHLRFAPGASGLLGVGQAGDDPRRRLMLKSAMDLGPKLKLDLFLRNVGPAPAPALPGYTELDGRLAWAVTDRVELAVAGFNLLHDRHLEYPGAEAVPRSAMAELRLRF